MKLRGYRIELGEIEHLLLSHEGIEEVVVLLKGEEESDKYLVGYYVSDKELVVSDLRAHLLESLPEYMVPTYYVHMDSIPLMINGKVDRKSLPNPELTDDYVPPSNDVERVIIKISSDLLRIEEGMISATANFFELGGNSISAIRLINKVNKYFDTNLKLTHFYQEADLNILAEHVQISKQITVPEDAIEDKVKIKL